MFRYIAIVILIGYSLSANAQLTATYTDANILYKEGLKLYEDANFGLAKAKFKEVGSKTLSLFDETSVLLANQALFYHALSAVKGGYPEGEKALLDFYYSKRPNPLAYDAARSLGDLKYSQKRYNDAIKYYSLVETSKLSETDQVSLNFKKGYSHFVRKEFEAASSNFEPILGKDSDYYFATYYYMAMIDFFNADYDLAIEKFFIVENYPEYKTKIPYYIGQIYFAQQKYDDLIEYIPGQINNPGTQNIKELRHILGQTYFLLSRFEEALPHLEFYESQSRKMRKEDFYQLAFTQYQLGLYEKAATNFQELSNLDSYLGQVSNNYLADAYLKIDRKEEARISFKNVMDFNLNREMEAEATFNYGKLSAELGFDRAAIKALMSLPPSDAHYVAAQEVLGSLFESSKDYAMVIQTIEGMDQKAPKILQAYQKVILERGIQLMNDGDRKLAKQTLFKAVETPIDNYYSAIIYYYIGDLLHQERNYRSSIDYLNKYFTLAAMVSKLPESAGTINARYLQGYNYFKSKDYRTALENFNSASGLMKAKNYGASGNIKKIRMYADVSNRLGDCYFTRNDYPRASENYKIASSLTFPGQDYAYFQRSMIQGLQGNPFEKIVLLEQLISVTPTSSFIDDSYFQIGETQLTLGNTREAELAFEKILNQKRRSSLTTRALLKLGLIAYNSGDANKAIKSYESVFKYNPNKNEAQEALLALEEIYVQDLGRAADFVAMVEKTTGYKMTSLERDSLTYVAAQGKFDNGEYIVAIENYTKYIQQYPAGINRLSALYNRAESHTILKNYADALPDYDKVIAIGQSDFYEDAIHKAALISYNDLQKFEEAFNYYSLLSDVTNDEQLRHEAELGALRSASRFGAPDAVLAMATKVINSNVGLKEDKAIAYFFSGKIHYERKSWEAALANLQLVTELADNENAAEAHYLINDIMFKNGDAEKAEARTLETVSNSTAYPYWVARNLILYADITLAKVDLFNARAALEAVIENFPESEELQAEAKMKLDAVVQKEDEVNRLQQESETIELDTTKGNE